MATITTLEASDSGSLSRGVINTNIENLNTDKIETSTLDTDVSLTADSDTKIATQKATKAYVDAAGLGNASTSSKGVVELATEAELKAGTATGSTGASLAVTPDIMSDLVYPRQLFPKDMGGSATMYQGYGDTIFTSAYTTGAIIRLAIDGEERQYYTATADWADVDYIGLYGTVILGDYAYFLASDFSTTPDTQRMYRYAKNDLAAGGTLMTIAGQAFVNVDAMKMTSNGTDFYFNFDAGTSANSYDIARYTLSGTTLTYADTTTCGSTAIDAFAVNSSGDIYLYDYTPNQVWRYNSSGVLQWTSEARAYQGGTIGGFFNFNDNFYLADPANEYLTKVKLG